jgi:pyrroloquinoline quinone (PQQ) biosynthesis protein C
MIERLKVLEEEWLKCFSILHNEAFFSALSNGTLEIQDYKGFLRETYFNAAQNTKNMSMFQAHLQTDRRSLEAKFLKHAAMEIGHDELALNDLQVFGEAVEQIRNERPLPTTEALAAFIVFQIQHRNPLAYLGYLYHLESLPVHIGENALESLLRIGVPFEATTFLREHAEADPVHIAWNREYLEGFVKSDADFEAVLYGMRGTSVMHGVMLQGILNANRSNAQNKISVC